VTLPVEWWMRVDREGELEIARSALDAGGLWVLLAEDGQGGSELARLIAEAAEERGRTCCVGRDTQTVDTLRGALLHAWRQLIAPGPREFGMSDLMSREPVGLIAQHLRDELDGQAERAVLVLEQVDHARGIDGAGLAALDQLARGEQTVIVITANHRGTPWRRCDTLRKLRALGRFRMEHVLAAAEAAPTWPADADAQREMVQGLRSTLGQGTIQPDDAFSALAALA
jgi:hypothetical protein